MPATQAPGLVALVLADNHDAQIAQVGCLPVPIQGGEVP